MYDQFLSYQELMNYYARVKNYIDDGFRVDGLKEELELIFTSLRRKAGEERIEIDEEKLEKEIKCYIRRLRH
ncbi:MULTISPECIES: hypothetical protein [Alteribacter]|uniref:Uncharacterized protein n=1 Tax=Alteribacter keqinensis TaxID=2483800 RepID=A0A3M7TXF6_9BACI|nr:MULTISPECIES: hypothetical protein [Alteribacter]MBM7094314.1 hypothetical protein [Alteribacter salitolerans]RNA69454.1 hypothetical protein EBO34_05825 [Alteribacter keqinensis]